MFKLNLKIAWRNLWRSKGFTLINLGGLAIGLTCCMLLMLYVAYEWSYDRQFKNYKKTYVVYTNATANGQTFSWPWTPVVMASGVKATIPGVERTTHASYPYTRLISNGDKKFKSASMFVDTSFFKILDYKFIKGNPEKVLQETNTVILTKSLAEKLFGAEDPINKLVKVNNNADALKVEGVIEDVPANSTLKFDYIMPWSLYELKEPWVKKMDWTSSTCLTLVQLQSPDLFEKANQSIKGIYDRNTKDLHSEAMLHPLSKWNLYDEFKNGKSVGGKIDQLRIFMILAGCILLIACVNFMNLSTARSEKRAREVGVRKAIGSSRSAIIQQFMLESVILTLLATVIAFMLVELVLPYFNNLLNISLVIIYNDWKIWVSILGLMVITGLVAGSYPAIYLSSFEPIKVLKGFTVHSKTSLTTRKVLVVSQFVFASCLIVCTSVIYQQLNYIKNKPIGYDKNNLLQIAVQGSMQSQTKLQLLKDRLLKSGAATHVSLFSMDISEGGNNANNITWPNKNAKESVLFNHRGVGEDFVKTIGTELIEGREFSSKFGNDSSRVMINEAAVRIMQLKHPVGTMIKWGNIDLEIIGVVKDFVVESAYEKVAPMVFYDSNRDAVGMVLVRLNPAINLSASVAAIDEIVKQIEPNFPIERKFAYESFEVKYNNEKLLSTLSTWFGGFAIFISCLGLLGLALFMAEQRRKEISIRKVLGAGTYSILSLLNKDFLKLVVIANLIAFPIAYIIVNKWLSAFEFKIDISILPFAVSFGLSMLIAILTVSLQSFKVAKANPVDALKYE